MVNLLCSNALEGQLTGCTACNKEESKKQYCYSQAQQLKVWACYLKTIAARL